MNSKQFSIALISICLIILLAFWSLKTNLPIIKNYFKSSGSKNLFSNLKVDGNWSFQSNSDSHIKNSTPSPNLTERSDKEVKNNVEVNFIKFDDGTLYFTVENYSNEKISFNDCGITLRGVSDSGTSNYTNCSGQIVSIDPVSAKVIRFGVKTIRDTSADFNLFIRYDSQTRRNIMMASPEFNLL